VIRRRGKTLRTLLLLGTTGSTIADGVRGLWRGESRRRWMVPLLVFLCLTGLLLLLAAGIEGLAPFVYAIF
jgi:uncharacterized protein DUF5989